MVLIKQFKDAGPLHGIIGIITCSIWTLIWGWMNAARLNIKNLMLIWTILFVVYIILYIMGFGAMIASLGGMTPAPTP
jgi:putative Ca2+/H+ antiporter (TMEM165/GDT1 family)